MSLNFDYLLNDDSSHICLARLPPVTVAFIIGYIAINLVGKREVQVGEHIVVARIGCCYTVEIIGKSVGQPNSAPSENRVENLY